MVANWGAAVGNVSHWSHVGAPTSICDTIQRNNILEVYVDEVLEMARKKQDLRSAPLIDELDELDDLEDAVSDQYESNCESDDGAAAASPTSVPATTPRGRRGPPAPIINYQWNLNAQLEGAMKPLRILTLHGTILEGSFDLRLDDEQLSKSSRLKRERAGSLSILRFEDNGQLNRCRSSLAMLDCEVRHG